jgi:PAP2 superfamily/Wax ester synthase/diacylglycerol acyltransferase catalytic domain/WS/DGAT C-terminal domain
VGGAHRSWRPTLWRELLGALVLLSFYGIVATFDTRRHGVAEQNGRDVFRLERWLHIDIERTLNHWLAGQDVLRTIANYEYAISYVLAAVATLVWLYLRHPEAYRWARTSFALVNLLGITCFALYPVMPPRLVPDLDFIDTVRLGHTWGSWGSPLVSSANQLAAMPSLHVAWALWVSVVLVRVRAGRMVQLLSAVHVAGTTFVIMATANHYIVDAFAGAALVLACVAAVTPAEGAATVTTNRVPAADAFFLHVENPAAPQHVGGIVMLDTSGLPAGEPTAQKLAADIRARLDALPRFRQRLSASSRWRRARWEDCPELDWDWHVPSYDLTGPDGLPGGEQALHALLDELAATPFPRDRPMWRFAMIHGFAPGRACAVFLVHHAIADGIGVVMHALKFIEPPYTLPTPDRRGPGRLRTAAAIAVGLAQLATDGRPSGRLPSTGTAERRVGLVAVPLDEVRGIARRHGVRVTDVMLSAVAGGLRRAVSDPDVLPAKLRVSVTLMVRDLSSGKEGNATAAVIMDLPLGPGPELERLADIGAHSNRLRTGTRALATRFVMQTVGDLLPPPAHRWFARTVYGRRFFHAVVSNMPAPDVQLFLAGAPMRDVYPMLPLAPGAPLTAGALGWNGQLCLGIELDPGLVADREAFTKAVSAVFAELAAAPAASAPTSPARAGGLGAA